jgi:hypothetical protein
MLILDGGKNLPTKNNNENLQEEWPILCSLNSEYIYLSHCHLDQITYVKKHEQSRWLTKTGSQYGVADEFEGTFNNMTRLFDIREYYSGLLFFFFKEHHSKTQYGGRNRE